jgi:hypothetical protein
MAVEELKKRLALMCRVVRDSLRCSACEEHRHRRRLAKKAYVACVHRCGKVWAVNPREDGVAFRVWAFVIGSFNDWAEDAAKGRRHLVRRSARRQALPV